MAAKKLMLLSCALVLAGLGAGCVGGGDADSASAGPRSRTSRRGMLTFGRSKKAKAAEAEQARAAEAALDGYTPESGMTRDMASLQRREQAQAQVVARLAGTRGADPAEFAEEQEKLFALRDKIQAYDAALQRFEMAARARPEREPGLPPALVPEEMFAERAVRPASFDDRPARPAETMRGYDAADAGGGYSSYQASRGEDRLGGYGRPAGQNVTHARVNMNGGSVEEGEQVLYTSADAGVQQSSSLRPSVADPVPTRFAGAPVGRSNFSKPLKKDAGTKSRKPWEGGGNLFAEQGAPAAETRRQVPNIYAARAVSAPAAPAPAAEQETLWPAGMAMVPPAGEPGSLRPSPKTEVKLPAAAPKAAAVAAPVEKPAPAAAAMDDEVFSPSMFLGGGL